MEAKAELGIETTVRVFSLKGKPQFLKVVKT